MVSLQTDRHAFVSGKTRSGKTKWTQAFLNMFGRVVVHDPKAEWGMYASQNHYAIVHTPDQLITILQKGGKRIIYQPMAGDESIEGFDEFCHIIFEARNIGVVFDEAASYCLTNKVSKYTSALMRMGNGLGIGVISLTQRPRDVANVLLSESVIVVSFRLALKTDRNKIIETVGTTIEHTTLGKWNQMVGKNVEPNLDPASAVLVNTVLRTLPKWHYLLYDADTEETHICAPIPLRR